jgi:AcrR family transcriptional regulator
MVHKKKTKRPRGRPRAYDPDQALESARNTFWDGGFSGTSLDDLSSATGMNRPSLYGAFGDKHQLYLTTLERYRAFGSGLMKRVLSYEQPLAEALMRMYDGAISLYLDGGGRGCFLIGTAATEAVKDPGIRAMLAAGLKELDAQLEARFQTAIDRRELVSTLDAKSLALLAGGVLNALAVRARAGESRGALHTTAAAAVHLICGRPNAQEPNQG